LEDQTVARSEYYQDVGNPIQLDRIPRGAQPVISLAHLPIAAGEGLKKLLNVLAGAEVVLITVALLVHVEALSRLGQLLPFQLFLIGAALLAAFLWVSWRHILAAAMAAYASTGVLVFAAEEPALQLGIVAAAMSTFSWHYARHWLFLCTASPLPRVDATRLMAACRLPLFLLTLSPLLMYLIGVATGSWLLSASILIVLCCIQALTPRPAAAPGKLRVLYESAVAWLAYNPGELSRPGLRQAPSGSCVMRITITCLVVGFVGVGCLRFAQLSNSDGLQFSEPAASDASDTVFLAGEPESSAWAAVAMFACLNLMQLTLALAAPVLLVLPLLMQASRWRQTRVQAENWQSLITEIQHSPDSVERRSYYMGRVVSDGSPLIVPRQVFGEHGHFLGDAGSGKTSRGLAPWIEQTILFGDCSLVIVDLKADTLELLATALAAAESLQRRTGRRMPVKHFSNQSNVSTYAFNPLTQPYWRDFDSYIKTDIICGGAGLLYGVDYGAGWYSAANAAVLHHAIRSFPDVQTFRELAERVNYTVANAKKRDLHSELRNAGVHVQAVLDRLGSFDALNVAPGTPNAEGVHEHAINLADVFQRPQVLYFHLSSTLAAGSSPEIARLLVYSLLCAATQTKRRHQVFLVIDEFQRMVAHNVESMLQQARSMGVGVILANQSLQDLGELIPSVEANCRFRQCFSVSSLDDRERIVRASGETIERFTSHSTSVSSGGGSSSSTTVSEQVRARLSSNDILLASDHPLRSIVTISRGEGYAQYGGFPFVAESAFHISRAEYERRKTMAWPEPAPGTFIPKEQAQRVLAASPKPSTRSILPTEIIGDFKLTNLPQPKSPKRKRSDGESL
jgi:hypothetical protein